MYYRSLECSKPFCKTYKESRLVKVSLFLSEPFFESKAGVSAEPESVNRWDSLLLLELSAVWKATLEKSCVDIDKFQGSSKRTVSCAVVH